MYYAYHIWGKAVKGCTGGPSAQAPLKTAQHPAHLVAPGMTHTPERPIAVRHTAVVTLVRSEEQLHCAEQPSTLKSRLEINGTPGAVNRTLRCLVRWAWLARQGCAHET